MPTGERSERDSNPRTMMRHLISSQVPYSPSGPPLLALADKSIADGAGFEPAHGSHRDLRFPTGHLAISVSHPYPGPGGVPLPTLAIVSRSAHGSTRYCVP
jgi:hypothetical protein